MKIAMKTKRLIRFANIAGKLKKIKRKGWVRIGIKDPESVADHSFRTALLAMIFSDLKKINSEKVIRIALLHDLGESLIGDYTKHEKEKMGREIVKKERRAIKKILSFLPKNLKDKYEKLWREFDEGKTKEAKLVKEIDKLEMAIQAHEYLKQGYRKEKLKEFFEDAETKIKDKFLRKILKEIKP